VSLTTEEAQRLHKRNKTAEMLDALGYSAAATVLRQDAEGILTLPESLASTRDGREEARYALGEAFEDRRIAVIVIERGR
jgi:hypothetical protein